VLFLDLIPQAKADCCSQTRLRIGSQHCTAAFFLQVLKSCTDLDLILFCISILKTYSKSAWKNKMLTLGVCMPQQCPSAGRRFAASRSHLNYVIQNSFRFHFNKFDEMPFKLDSSEFARSFRTNPNPAGGPERSEKQIHEILDMKSVDRFSDPFLDLIQNTSLVRFSYLLRLCNFCKALRDMRKFPQKCKKIAGCQEYTVYVSRPPIASTPGSNPPERPSRDNITSQPWSDANCP